jgi:hypothetical protein
MILRQQWLFSDAADSHPLSRQQPLCNADLTHNFRFTNSFNPSWILLVKWSTMVSLARARRAKSGVKRYHDLVFIKANLLIIRDSAMRLVQ